MKNEIGSEILTFMENEIGSEILSSNSVNVGSLDYKTIQKSYKTLKKTLKNEIVSCQTNPTT